MKEIRPASEDEVIAAFLRAEIDSPRWSATLRAFLSRDRMAERTLTTPDLANPMENAYRRRLLGEFRGWGTDQLLLRGFPADLSWSLVAVTPAELVKIQYISRSYWLDISGGTRLASDAAARIRAGAAEEHRASYEQIAARIRAGDKLPEIIAVTGRGREDRIVAVEGHARLTGYLLAQDAMPNSIEIFLGRSASVANWGLY